MRRTTRGCGSSDSYDAKLSKGILLIDADNAFNRLNRAAALWNIQYVCPAMKHVLINFYRTPTRIFMNNEGNFELLSREGTTQGCPLAMAMYALGLVPLLKRLLPFCNQIWFADDASGCDKFEKLRRWFDMLMKVGPLYGYYPKPSKCILVAKENLVEQARTAFAGTAVGICTDGSRDVKESGVKVVSTGTRHLGAAVGTKHFQYEYVQKKIAVWIDCIKKLSDIATTEPHAAYSAYTHSLQSQWTFLCRTMPTNASWFQPLEDAIRMIFLPKLINRDLNDLERDLLSLPARLGGMGITKPTEECLIASTNSIFISMPLVRLVQRQEFELDPTALLDKVRDLRKVVDRENDARNQAKLETILSSEHASKELKVALKACSQKGASSWVTAYPNYDHETILHKGDFIDAVCIRYGWPPPKLPALCKCGAAFDVQHALDCMLGGFRIIQHNETRDTMAQCMRDAGYPAVEVEPQLQELSGEKFEYKSTNKEVDARSDIKCYGFWKDKRQAFFDIKVVSPFARSYVNLKPEQLFRQAELQKYREYGPRIRDVEHADFNPLVFTCTGGMAPQSSVVIKRLAERLSKKKNLHTSVVSGWLRCRLSFALLRTTILCLRGTRRYRAPAESNIELAVAATHMDY